MLRQVQRISVDSDNEGSRQPLLEPPDHNEGIVFLGQTLNRLWLLALSPAEQMHRRLALPLIHVVSWLSELAQAEEVKP